MSEFNQLNPPKAGDTVAVISTSMGDISIVLFPEKTPKTFENFTTHAKSGYYNGLKFHRVMKDFMIQTGDPQGTGMGGESIWGAPFKDEPDIELRNYRGALSMANAGPGTNGSQFFIVQKSDCPDSMLQQMKEAQDNGFPAAVTENYQNLGGTPWLDFRHTVFGQVFEGLEVVDKIANSPTNSRDMPLEDIVINSVTIKTFE